MTKFTVKKWTPDLDLEFFYAEAKKRGFENNATEKMLVQSLSNEEECIVWIVYYDNTPVGSFAAHKLDFLPGYRICTRICAFTDLMPLTSIRTRKEIAEHQHITGQIFIPVTIEHYGKDKNFYISTHPSSVGTQRAVHNVWAPTLLANNTISLETVTEYRGHEQHFWKLNVDVFEKDFKQMKEFEYTLDK